MAKSRSFGDRNIIFGKQAQCDKVKQKKLLFLKISDFDEFGGPFKKGKRGPRGQNSYFWLQKCWDICARSGPPQLGVVLVLYFFNCCENIIQFCVVRASFIRDTFITQLIQVLPLQSAQFCWYWYNMYEILTFVGKVLIIIIHKFH